MAGLTEFDLIDKYLRPLAEGSPGAFALTDDAAVLPELPNGMACVVTKDALAMGTHMVPSDPPDSIAQKAVRTNMSDLAAMGAEPVCIFMALCLGQDTSEAFLKTFVQGLKLDIEQFGIALMGGDVIRHEGPFMVSITALGQLPRNQILRRSGAEEGDDVWVSGTLGDAALGLAFAQGNTPGKWTSLGDEHGQYLLSRYRLPLPRITLGPALRGVATSCIDVSDGLCADLQHICDQSGVACSIEYSRVPMSDAVRATEALDHRSVRAAILTGGDDYELAFTAPVCAQEKILSMSSHVGVQVTRIGRIVSKTAFRGEGGAGVSVKDETGRPIELKQAGYLHSVR